MCLITPLSRPGPDEDGSLPNDNNLLQQAPLASLCLFLLVFRGDSERCSHICMSWDEFRWFWFWVKQSGGVRDWGLRVSDREPAESCVCCVECLKDRLVFTQLARPFSPMSPGSSLLHSITPWLFNTSSLLRFCVQPWLRQADNLSPVCFGKHRRCK